MFPVKLSPTVVTQIVGTAARAMARSRLFLLSALACSALAPATFAGQHLAAQPQDGTSVCFLDTEREEYYSWRGYYVLINERGSKFTYSASGSVYATSKSEAERFAQAELAEQSNRMASIGNDTIGDIGITSLSKW